RAAPPPPRRAGPPGPPARAGGGGGDGGGGDAEGRRARGGVGGGGGLGRAVTQGPRARPPVLCYHRVGGPLELGVTRVAESVFQRQMSALARAGWTTLTLGEFFQRLRSDGSPVGGQPAFLLSFDDGYASLAERAYPILAELGFS